MVQNVDILSNPKNAFWRLSSPLVLLTLFQACYSLVDLFWVSQLSQEAFFAIGVATPIVTLINNVGDSIGIGTNSVMSRELGDKDHESANNSLLHGIVACAAISVGIIIISLFSKEIFGLMNVSVSFDLTIKYLGPIFLFSCVFLFSSLFVNTVQAEGNSRLPTYLLIISNILNLILDPILIFIFDWGVTGAAYASIFASLVTVLYLLYWYLSGKSRITLNFRYFKPGIVYQIFVVAIPNFIMDGLWCITMMYANKILIEQLGQIGVLLYSTSLNIESFIVAPEKAFGKAAVTISGYLFGAKEQEALKRMYSYVLKVSIGLVVVCAIAFFFVRDYGFALFSITGAETSIFYIALLGIFILPCDVVLSISNKMLDGIGKSYHSLILSAGIIALEIVAITLLAPILTSGVCVLVGILISEFVFAVIYYILVKNMLNGKNWMEEKIRDKIDEKKEKKKIP